MTHGNGVESARESGVGCFSKGFSAFPELCQLPFSTPSGVLSYLHSLWILVFRFFCRVRNASRMLLFWWTLFLFRMILRLPFAYCVPFFFLFFAVVLRSCLSLFPSPFCSCLQWQLCPDLLFMLVSCGWVLLACLPCCLRHLGSAVSCGLVAWRRRCEEGTAALPPRPASAGLLGFLPLHSGVLVALSWFCPPALVRLWALGAFTSLWGGSPVFLWQCFPFPKAEQGEGGERWFGLLF